MFNLFPKQMELPKEQNLFNYTYNPVQSIMNIGGRIVVMPNVEFMEDTEEGLKIHYLSGFVDTIKGVKTEAILKELNKP